jgi:hypothetical protein
MNLNYKSDTFTNKQVYIDLNSKSNYFLNKISSASRPSSFMVFLRGITSKTTEMLVDDPIAETSRLRRIRNNAGVKQDSEEICDAN